MSTEIVLTIDQAFRQAKATAHDYLMDAYKIMSEGYDSWEMADVIALAHIMALDFNNTALCIKLQEIRDVLDTSLLQQRPDTKACHKGPAECCN
jgi:hypothetical protein